MIGRREARREERRGAILALAERHFLGHGYSATAMSAIAAELGGSKGTLWSYFASKELLFDAVLDAMIARFVSAIDEALVPDACPARTLERFARVLLGRIAQPDAIALHRMVVCEGDRFPALARRFYELGPQRVRAHLAEYLEGQMAAGLLRTVDAGSAAVDFMALCRGRGHYERLLGGPAGDAAAHAADAAAATDCFMRAYAPPPA